MNELLCLPEPRLHVGPDRHGAVLHDFSTNGNACGPYHVRQADASRYPDGSYSALRRQLAEFHVVDFQWVVLAGSAREFIFRISALAGQVAQCPPCPDAAGQASGCGAVWLPAQSYNDYAQAARAHRLALTADLAQAPLIWACEPSIPTGAAKAGLSGRVDQQAGNFMLVLKGAYEPLRLGGAPSLTLVQRDTVWQLWTHHKSLGLTGVRAAYAIAPLQAQAQVAALD